jgi:hypothetical protein
VYVVAAGNLTGTTTNEHGEKAQAGQPNLYLLHGGTATFIATLSPQDDRDWAGGGTTLNGLTARVSPDGRWFAFMSQRSLTGYDNRDARSGAPDEEVFLYHAGGSGGGLACVSCDPTGARPDGVEYEAFPLGSPVQGDRVWSGSTWLAANIPGWTPYKDGQALYQSRYLSDGGRLFFNSADGLVSTDTNGTWDVYEYEPPGGGGEAPPNDSCGVESSGYDPGAEGCLSLISSGTSSEESGFLDASESGNDVFFLTGSHLSPLDVDDAPDVYDAHVCTSQSPCPPPPPPSPPSCQGDGCQAQTVAPEALTPGSLTFSGPGNAAPEAAAVTLAPKAKPLTRAQKLASALRTCGKRPKRKRSACEKSARRAYGADVRPKTKRKGAGR